MCIYTYIRIHMHTRTHTKAHTHTHTNIHTQIHKHTHMHMHMHAHAHAHNAHARAHTHTHTHTKRTAPQAVRRRRRWGRTCGFKSASCPSGVGSAFGPRPGLFFFLKSHFPLFFSQVAFLIGTPLLACEVSSADSFAHTPGSSIFSNRRASA